MAPLRKCPDCGKSQLRRLVSAPQFRLKGSGWYETDFKNKSETKRNLVEKAGAESSEGGERQVHGYGGEGRSRQSRRGREEGRASARSRSPRDEAENRAETTKPSSRETRKPAVKSRARTARR